MKDKQQEPLSFSAGKKELESIRQSLEKSDFEIDHLEELIDRGRYLIEFLTDKLRKMDEKINDSAKI